MIEKNYDIVIVGGGTAGVAAAIGASNNGNSVLLIEKTTRLGGQATSAEVGTVCGLYLNSSDDIFELNVNEFTQQFSSDLKRLSNSKPIRNSSGLKFLPYSISVLDNYCKSILKENNILYITDSELNNVEVLGGKITSIELVNNQEVYKILPKSVVDSSGVSIVSELLGDDLMVPQFSQMNTQIFTISGGDFSSEQNVNLILLMKMRIQNSHDVSVVPGSYSKQNVSLKLNFKEIFSIESILQKVNSAFEFLKNNIDGFKNSKIESIAPSMGIRIASRAFGKYVLTEEDVLSCRKFDNTIANGNWPIEQWDSEKGLIIKELKEKDYYQIPMECLESNKYTNLFFAGRNISATDQAIGSARVIGTCLQTGFEAGRMASRIID